LAWAKELKDLLLDMKDATQQARQQGKLWLDPLEVVDWQARFAHEAPCLCRTEKMMKMK
jgi:hypothetical protein